MIIATPSPRLPLPGVLAPLLQVRAHAVLCKSILFRLETGSNHSCALSDIERPQSCILLAAVRQWEYKDLDGQTHGPFSSEKMRQWSAKGYFQSDLQVRIPLKSST